jgi:hypothetical protein
MTTKTRYPVARNCNFATREDDRGRLVWQAIEWADAGKLDANIGDEEAVLIAIDELEETLTESAEQAGPDNPDACEACEAAEEEVAATLQRSRSWVLDRISGMAADDPEAVAAMEACGWDNAMPVIDGDRRLTGAWVYWDTDDQTYANYDDNFAISIDDAEAAGWTVADGYAEPPAA